MRTVAVVTLCLIACMSGVWADTSGSGSLLAKAKPVCAMKFTAQPQYCWLSAHRIVLFEHTPKPVSPAERKELRAPNDYAPGHFRAVTIDVPGGKRAPFSVFNQTVGDQIAAQPMIMSFGGGPPSKTIYNMPSWSFLPDLSWFAWVSPFGCGAVTLDGRRRLTWTGASPDDHLIWISSTQCAIVEASYSGGTWIYTRAVIHNVSGGAERSVPIDQPERGLLVGAEPNGSLLVLGHGLDSQSPVSAVQAYSYDLSGARAKVTRYAIPLPGTYGVWGATLSSSRDRLAWVLSKGETYFLYVSDLKGTHWSCLGKTAEVESGKGANKQISWPNGVRWLPNDSALSFQRAGELYELPVPKGA